MTVSGAAGFILIIANDGVCGYARESTSIACYAGAMLPVKIILIAAVFVIAFSIGFLAERHLLVGDCVRVVLDPER